MKIPYNLFPRGFCQGKGTYQILDWPVNYKFLNKLIVFFSIKNTLLEDVPPQATFKYSSPGSQG